MNYCALDIGNVLVHVNFQPFLNQLSKSLNITLEEAGYFMNRSQCLHDLGCTTMLSELKDHFKIRSPIIIEELIEKWNKVIEPNFDIIHRIDRMIRHDDLQIALLSNVGLEHAQQMAQILDIGDFFKSSIKFFSCHVGARKPTLVYYHTFLQLHPTFKGCPYVDDLQENLNAAQQFGFKTMRFSLEDVMYEGSTTAIGRNYHDKTDQLERFVLGKPKQ
jgi:FMN phosphatase YigB (HAD superfamily)